MSGILNAGVIQLANSIDSTEPCEKIRAAMIEAHLPYIQRAGREGVQILCLQELFNSPYFCPSQDPKWFAMAEEIPGGPTTQIMQDLAKETGMVIVMPIYEKEMSGVYYNTAAVIDADGKYLGKYRKNHIPHVNGFWEKFFFKPGNLGYPVFETAYAKIGVYICYDRHFPEGARILGLNGAEIVFNPSATVSGLSQYLWELEQPSHAAANGYFIAAVNRVGREPPWNLGEFYGSSYFANPRGEIIAQASQNASELISARLDLSMIDEVRNLWQFYRDRRPETYNALLN